MNPKSEITSSLKPLVILLYTPIVLTVFRYYGSADFYIRRLSSSTGPESQYYYFISSFILLGMIPLLIWIFGFKLSLAQIGLTPGNYRSSIFLALAGLPVIILIAFLSSKNPAIQAEYPLYRGILIDQRGFLLYILLYGLYYIGWETFFRGFMLFGLKDRLGVSISILVQTIPSCLMHIGKPSAEIFASIIAGIVFGWIAIRCRSILPVILWHWCLGVSLDLFIVYA